MRKVIQTAAALAFCAAAMTATTSAQAAPNQMVVVVAEGLSPQVVELGSSYIKSAATDPDATISFSDLKSQGKSAVVNADALASMRGVLKLAQANGYKTGLVTSGDVANDAALFYDLPSDTKLTSDLLGTVKPNFLAGGGRGKFSADVTKSFTTAGNTALLNADDFENIDEVKGNVLALQSDGDLSYALDRDSSSETGIGDLASLAMTTLGGEDSTKPYLLIVHDTNIAKALAAKDTPALLGEFRELDGIIGDVLSTRSSLETPANLGLAVVSTGAASFPKFSSEIASERSDAIYIASQLTSSYAKTTTTLKGATDEDITTFSTDVYPKWKPSAETRAALTAGTTTGESAVRASYETAIAINYADTTVEPMAYVLGLDSNDVVKSVGAFAATKATTTTTK